MIVMVIIGQRYWTMGGIFVCAGPGRSPTPSLAITKRETKQLVPSYNVRPFYLLLEAFLYRVNLGLSPA